MRSNQRPDTLMQDRICQVDETSCNARPDHTLGQVGGRPLPVFPWKRTSSEAGRNVSKVPNSEVIRLHAASLMSRRLNGAGDAACSLITSEFVKVFGCRPHDGGAAHTGGRRPQTSKGGNRGEAWRGSASVAMGISLLSVGCEGALTASIGSG